MNEQVFNLAQIHHLQTAGGASFAFRSLRLSPVAVHGDMYAVDLLDGYGVAASLSGPAETLIRCRITLQIPS